jgi:two-component system invasion response regulator UvrY
MAGKQYVCNEVAQKLALNKLGNTGTSPFQSLSEREFQVLGLIIKGLKVIEISDQLCLSPKTISTYRHRLLIKLNVQNEMELARLAMQHGFIEEKPLP